MTTSLQQEKLPHSGMTRRGLVQAGAVGFLGLSMPQLATLRALAARGPRHQPAKSVIFIYAVGGLSQLDTFDMKPEAPAEIRGDFKPISTTVPGMKICEHLPLLAERARSFSLVRSLSHPYTGHGDGHMVMQSGRTPLPPGFVGRTQSSDWPSIAANVNYATKSRGMPQAAIVPELMDNQGLVSGQGAGVMGANFNPWLVQASGTASEEWGACPDCWGKEGIAHSYECRANPLFAPPQLKLPEDVSEQRVHRRLELLKTLEQKGRDLSGSDVVSEWNRYRQQMVSLMLEQRTRQALDVRRAPDHEQDRYGRNKFGWSVLMARRLVEAGVNMVQVNLGHTGTWDTHWQNFSRLKNWLLPPTDRAISALLDDLHERNLLDDVLVVLASEFGRTPKISLPDFAKGAEPGRDHWGFVQSVLFAGGGVQGGRIVGKTDKQAAYPTAVRKTPEDFAATIYHALGIPKTATWNDQFGRPHPIYHGEPIEELM